MKNDYRELEDSFNLLCNAYAPNKNVSVFQINTETWNYVIKVRF